jgi:hypothetical protein
MITDMKLFAMALFFVAVCAQGVMAQAPQSLSGSSQALELRPKGTVTESAPVPLSLRKPGEEKSTAVSSAPVSLVLKKDAVPPATKMIEPATTGSVATQTAQPKPEPAKPINETKPQEVARQPVTTPAGSVANNAQQKQAEPEPAPARREAPPVSQPQVAQAARPDAVKPEEAEAPNPNTPRYFSIFIAVSDYQHASWNLPNLERPVQDARRFHQLLTTQYQFDPKLSRLLLNPTRAQIIDLLEKLAEEVTPNDNLLFFFAGHGYFDKTKNIGFWLPSNASMTSRSEWLPNSQIKDYIGAINSKHTLLMADACFSGSIFKSRMVTDNSIKQASDSYKMRSRRAITSGNLTEVPDQSVFLDALLKALQTNDKKFATGQQIFVRVYDVVTNNSHTVPQYGIIQGTGDEGGDFLFILR